MKAIETRYQGYRFRSRTEARHAVFLDTLGIRWEYEKQGFDLGRHGRYLPDFWLPDYGYWLEIKGQRPTEGEREKARALRDEGERPVVLLVGEPMAQAGETYICDSTDSSAGTSDGYAAWWFICPVCGRPDVTLCDVRSDREVLDGRYEVIACCWNSCLATRNLREQVLNEVAELGVDWLDYRLRRAVEASRSARFEHGESGAPLTGTARGDAGVLVIGEAIDWPQAKRPPTTPPPGDPIFDELRATADSLRQQLRDLQGGLLRATSPGERERLALLVNETAAQLGRALLEQSLARLKVE